LTNSNTSDLKLKFATAFDIDFAFVVDAAARRQKWIDQSQSVNLFLGKPEIKALSHMYRSAWRKGLKTTYYLRTLGASNIEKATVAVKKETRGHIARGEDEAPGIAAAIESTGTVPPIPKRLYSDEEKAACSLEARRNGESCEACQ
jgi:ribonucleoside-diphosphate reductase alpha chain